MKAFISLALVVFLALPSIRAEHAPVKAGNDAFAFNLYQQLSQKTDNVIFSPVSLHSVLSMTYQGAGGTTKKAFAEVLGVSEQSTAAEGYNKLFDELKDSPGAKVIVANKAYVKPGLKLNKNFQDSVTNKFHSELEVVNFADGAAAASTINSWVKGKTQNKITELLKSDDLNSDTHFVLINTLYFKAPWQFRFFKEGTTNEPFYVDEDTKVSVPMMTNIIRCNHKEDEELDATIVELPFLDQSYVMMIYLPHEKNGIHDLEQRMATYDVNKVRENFVLQPVELSLPKFKLEQSIDLEDSLSQIGLGEIFDASKCDLTAMTEDGEDMYIDKVIQKVFIDVNESGCEAGAATAALGHGRSLVRDSINVDHPFIFTIEKKGEDGDTVLFAGRVMNPSQH